MDITEWMNKKKLLKDYEIKKMKSKIWMKYLYLPFTSQKETFEWDNCFYESFSGLKLI